MAYTVSGNSCFLLEIWKIAKQTFSEIKCLNGLHYVFKEAELQMSAKCYTHKHIQTTVYLINCVLTNKNDLLYICIKIQIHKLSHKPRVHMALTF